MMRNIPAPSSPVAEAAAVPAEANQEQASAEPTAQKAEDKAAPRGFADLKERFRRPFP